MTLEDFSTDRFTRLSDVLAATDARLRQGESAAARPWATGFDPLDSYLAGGLRPGELTLLGGPQGLGKTTFALQVARHVLSQGHPVLYVCYEHDAVNLLERLLAAEAGERAGLDAVPLRSVRALLEGDGSAMSLTDKLGRDPGRCRGPGVDLGRPPAAVHACAAASTPRSPTSRRRPARSPRRARVSRSWSSTTCRRPPCPQS